MLALRLAADEATALWLSDALMELDALSVSVADQDAGTDEEEALFGEPGLPTPGGAWRHSHLTALFEDRRTVDHALTVLQLQPDWGQTRVHGIDLVADTDWVRLTQQQFDPVEITPDFWVVPSWHETPDTATRVIRLDPGLAFGTGSHPTTRMCLRWIAEQAADVRGARFMDYGCGSGILAIGACLHGAADVHAVDIDPAALQASLDNARANQVHISVADVADPASETERFDIVLANILSVPLQVLAPVLCNLLRPGGSLTLAGILDRQAQDLRSAYAPWLQLAVVDELDGWILMSGTRPHTMSTPNT